jgi:hypothetical protein
MKFQHLLGIILGSVVLGATIFYAGGLLMNKGNFVQTNPEIPPPAQQQTNNQPPPAATPQDEDGLTPATPPEEVTHQMIANDPTVKAIGEKTAENSQELAAHEDRIGKIENDLAATKADIDAKYASIKAQVEQILDLQKATPPATSLKSTPTESSTVSSLEEFQKRCTPAQLEILRAKSEENSLEWILSLSQQARREILDMCREGGTMGERPPRLPSVRPVADYDYYEPPPAPEPEWEQPPASSNTPTEYCDVCEMFTRGQQSYNSYRPRIVQQPRQVRQTSFSSATVCFWVLNRRPTAVTLFAGVGPSNRRSHGLVTWAIDPGAWELSSYYPGFYARQVCAPRQVFESYSALAICGDVGYQNFLAGGAIDTVLRRGSSPESDPACIAGSWCPPGLR